MSRRARAARRRAKVRVTARRSHACVRARCLGQPRRKKNAAASASTVSERLGERRLGLGRATRLESRARAAARRGASPSPRRALLGRVPPCAASRRADGARRRLPTLARTERAGAGGGGAARAPRVPRRCAAWRAGGARRGRRRGARWWPRASRAVAGDRGSARPVPRAAADTRRRRRRVAQRGRATRPRRRARPRRGDDRVGEGHQLATHRTLGSSSSRRSRAAACRRGSSSGADLPRASPAASALRARAARALWLGRTAPRGRWLSP